MFSYIACLLLSMNRTHKSTVAILNINGGHFGNQNGGREYKFFLNISKIKLESIKFKRRMFSYIACLLY